ncbi:hypothetical protein TNCV_697881 [Trichonephila clavipes]|nr:hypothetical protein TNCV_697881 [Trichonephila clavipes]
MVFLVVFWQTYYHGIRRYHSFAASQPFTGKKIKSQSRFPLYRSVCCNSRTRWSSHCLAAYRWFGCSLSFSLISRMSLVTFRAVSFNPLGVSLPRTLQFLIGRNSGLHPEPITIGFSWRKVCLD